MANTWKLFPMFAAQSKKFMATVTNKNGLPQPIVDALAYDTHRIHGDISVTQLIDAPQVRVLKMKHSRELESDVSEMLWALLGTAVHHILERSHIKDKKRQAFLTVLETLKEESMKYESEKDKEALQGLQNALMKLMVKFFPEIDGRYIWESTLQYDHNGMLLYGTFDIYDKWEKCLYDYKVCSVYAYLYPESRRKWTSQTNTYAFLLREKGYEVNLINIVAIFRDWSASKLEFSKGDYPTAQFMTIPIQVVEHERMRKWVHGRIELHQKAAAGEVPECSGEDRWATADEFLAKTKKVKLAIRKFATEDACDEFIEKNSVTYEHGLQKIIRPGESKRCASYCPVRDFCPQKAKADKQAEIYLNSTK